MNTHLLDLRKTSNYQTIKIKCWINEVYRDRAQSFLQERNIQKILKAYRSFQNVDGFASVATLDEIRANYSNLSIPLYVRPTSNETKQAEETSLAGIITEWEQGSSELRLSMEELLETLKGVGYGD